MTSGWAWVLKMCLCTRGASRSLWRPFRTSTSSSSALLSPAPTRSLWTRERCSLKRHRWNIFSVNVRLCVFVWGGRISQLSWGFCLKKMTKHSLKATLHCRGSQTFSALEPKEEFGSNSDAKLAKIHHDYVKNIHIQYHSIFLHFILQIGNSTQTDPWPIKGHNPMILSY